MLSLFFKCLLGALAVLIIALFSRSKIYYIAGLVPLFPTFALIAHVIVVQEQGTEALRKTALFGLWSLIPYAMYLLTVYLLATKMTAWGVKYCNCYLDNNSSNIGLYMATHSINNIGRNN